MFKSKQLWCILLAVFLFISPANAQIFPGPQAGGSGTSAVTPAFTESILGAAANNITVTLSDPDKIYNAAFYVKTNASSNLVYITLNGDTAQTGYAVFLAYNSTSNFAHVGASNNSAILQNASLASGLFASGTLTVQRFYDGSNTYFSIRFTSEIAAGHTSGFVTKTVSGDVDLTSIAVYSNQTNGFAAGSYIKPIT